ncbi:MAG: hypothetical protein KAV00_18570, partial [Phycisphaerae bacterium]|nr:hypothetical protein [Phycisphaerae bacterium]
MFDPNKQIQSLPFDVADCPTLDDVLSMFEEQHRRSEILYKGDGIWDDGRPRNTSRRVLGYIDADYKTPRIVEGLKHLSKYEYDGFYEGGLAAATLALGSARVSRKYIHPAIDLCKKMYHVSPSNSPNMDGFATFGLAETARAIDPNNPAVAFLMAAQNLMCVNVLRQTPTGTWSLHRDQKIYYHSIVTRGLISLLAMLP